MAEPEATIGGGMCVPPLLARATRWLALAGGCLMVAVAFVVVFSVIGRAGASYEAGRTLGFDGVAGDFEMVQIATALAVFSFLPYCQARRGNIIVDTFSGFWRQALQRVVDGVFDIVYAAFMAMIAARLWIGAMEAMTTGTGSMVLGIPLWPAILACAVLGALLAIVALATAFERFRGARRGGAGPA